MLPPASQSVSMVSIHRIFQIQRYRIIFKDTIATKRIIQKFTFINNTHYSTEDKRHLGTTIQTNSIFLATGLDYLFPKEKSIPFPVGV